MPRNTEAVGSAGAIGSRVLVIGMAAAGKSTFSRALAARTGLPLIHLDVHYWKPGWVKPSESEWRDKQRDLLKDAPGSQTATTLSRSIFGLDARTRSFFSKPRGGFAHAARSFAACASP